jgi:hypothetical protein
MNERKLVPTVADRGCRYGNIIFLAGNFRQH